MRLSLLFPLALTALVATAAACSSESTDTLGPAPAPQSADNTDPAPPAEGTPPAVTQPSKTVPTNGSKGCGVANTLKGGSDLKITAAGSKRNYGLSLPTGYDPYRGYPLVFALHGSGGNGEGTRRNFDFESFAGDKAVFVYPDGENGGWDLDSPSAQNRDVALFDALVSDLESKLCIDTKRVFATGYSMGAYFANQLGCRRGDKLRAIAPHAGGGPYENNGKYTSDGHLDCAQKPVAAMIFIGLADSSVDPSEGQKSLSHWTWADGCKAQTSPIEPGPCVAYQGCKQPVITCKIPGLGHSVWKEGSKATWNFFASLE